MNVGTFPIVATVNIHFSTSLTAGNQPEASAMNASESDNQTISVQVDFLQTSKDFLQTSKKDIWYMRTFWPVLKTKKASLRG